MKIALSKAAVLLILLVGCAPQPGPENAAVPTQNPAVFQTPVGELEQTWTRLVQGVNSTIASPGFMVLLVGLRRPDAWPVDLQKFQDAHMRIFVQVDGGEKILSTIGGFLGPNSKEFAVGFLVPEGVKT